MARATATRTNRELVGCFMADDMCLLLIIPLDSAMMRFLRVCVGCAR